MAGVLLVEKYRNNFGRIDYAVILFYNIYKDTYEDPGGHLTERKTIQESAAKELIEESCNLFRINPLYLKRIIKSDFFEIKKYFSKGYTILLNKNNLKNVWNHSYEYNDYIELYLPNIFIKLYKYNSDNNYVYFKYSNDIYEGYEFSNEYEYIMASMIR